MSKKFGKWDKGLDFEEVYTQLKDYMISVNSIEHKVKSAILLIQIRNGARVGEAVNAYNQFIKTNKRNSEVFAEKRRNKPYLRPITIPDEVPNNLPLYTKTNENLWNFANKYFNMNTHSLRYAFITYLGVKKKLPAQTMAKITGHRNLNQLIDYIQEKEAKRVLKEDVI